MKLDKQKQSSQMPSIFNASRYPKVRAIVDAGKDSVQTLADMVGETILKQIISNELPAGTALTTNGVAESLGVSRTPVAKALAKLTADGILVQPNHENAQVSVDAASWLEQSREFRTIIEAEAAFRAAGRIDAEVLDDLQALSREAKPNSDFEWTEAAIFFDAALHLAIAEFCGNSPMKVAIRKCWTYKRLTYSIYPRTKVQLKADYEQHVGILKSLISGDGEQAWKAMTSHLQSATRTLRRARAHSR